MKPTFAEKFLTRQIYRCYYKTNADCDGRYSKDFTAEEIEADIEPWSDADKLKSISTTLGQLAKNGGPLGKSKDGKATKYWIRTRREEAESLQIKNFQEFKTELEKFKRKNPGKRLFFRGESGLYTCRTPSMNREEWRNIAKRSDRFYADLAVELGDLELQQQSLPTQLARFQHYQAPTRLLDVSTNPLVSLFFAVEDENNGEGSRIFFYAVDEDKIKYQSGRTANMKAAVNWISQSVVYNFLDYESSVDSLTENKEDQRVVDFMTSLNQLLNPVVYINSREIYHDLMRSHFVQFVRDSIRLQRQQGAFIMPRYLTGYEDESEMEGLNNSIRAASADVAEFVIPEDCVSEIKRYLSILGMNAGTAYPDIEHFALYLRDFYKNFSD